MPFCRLHLSKPKPKNDSYLWKLERSPANPKQLGEQILKRRYNLKMPAYVCQKLLGVDKGTLCDWEKGKHKASEQNRRKIERFLKQEPL